MLDKRRIIVHDNMTFEQMKSFGYVRGKLTGIACHDDLSMPIFNHVPRMLDEKSFVGWIEEYLYFGAGNPSKVYELNSMIKQWVMDNPEMTQESFELLYGLNENNGTSFNGLNTPLIESAGMGTFGNPYSNSGYGSGNPYSGMSMGNPYSGMSGGSWGQR